MLPAVLKEAITTIDDENKIARAETPKTIKELFAGYDGEYTPEEIDWGEPVGEENVDTH